MSRLSKVLDTILRGNSDANIAFRELIHALEALGFECRVRGDHHILTLDCVQEILNLQPRNGKAKPYQVKQVRNILTTYSLIPPAQSEDTEP